MKTREPMTAKERIQHRLCAAALVADEALPHTDEAMVQPWRKELCNAADDYWAGEELPRNRPPAAAPPSSTPRDPHVCSEECRGEPHDAIGAGEKR